MRWVHGRTDGQAGWSWTDCESSFPEALRSPLPFHCFRLALAPTSYTTAQVLAFLASCLHHSDRNLIVVLSGSRMSKPTAAGGAGVGPSRRTWDVEEYTSKARERDREDKERAQQNEERIRKGECGESSEEKRSGKSLQADIVRTYPCPRPAITGQKPLPRTSKLDSLPQPTSHLQPRSQPLDLDKDVGKTLLVDNSGDSRRGAGYYCEVCRKTCKDSIGYLDHVNGRDRE